MKGRLVLDCSTLLPGPFLGKLLLDQGARVVKIENPDRPDGARAMAGAFYDELNRNKEVVWLNLAKESDRTRFHDWVRQADALIEGFRPKAKKKLALDEETLRAINPRLCIASLVGYPEGGPDSERAGHDLNFQARTGCLSLFEGMPGLPLADLFAAYQGALSLASMLDGVARGLPAGRAVVSMSEALDEVQGVLKAEYRLTGVRPIPGNTLFSGKFPCYRIYQAGDGRRIAIGAIEGKFWQEVCRILEVPQLVSEGFATGEAGIRAVYTVQDRLWSKPWEHWAPLFAAADCCVEPVLDYSDLP